jgi:broad specificity phosphatase PhoE
MPSRHDAHYRRVILIRHGESTANQKRLLTGRSDPELTGRGVRQARDVARLLGSFTWNVDTIFSSPLKRALHTARFISKRRALPVNESDLLLETDFGAWEEKGRDELKNIPQWDLYVQDPFHFQFPEGESPQDVRKRVGLFMESLRKNDTWDTAVVVSHYTPIAFFILHILGMDGGKRAPFAIDNASATVIRLSDDSGYIEKLNCTAR